MSIEAVCRSHGIARGTLYNSKSANQ
ncbi:MAG: hypothetical protein IJR06_02290 [Paludibacteraceae bacterium]|nr:hypothetical protein [Paludibacteraceae bacterium]